MTTDPDWRRRPQIVKRRDPNHVAVAVNVGLTPPELRRIDRAAERAGLRRSVYMRDVLLEASAPTKRRRLPRWLPE